MKLHLLEGKLNRKPRIEMLPLIDIVFLLLVFFIYAMLSMAVHRGLPVSLPVSSSAVIGNLQEISVTLTADDRVYLDDTLIALPEIHTALRAMASQTGASVALVFADRQASYQKLFSLLDQIRMAGISEISLQAAADGSR